MAKKRTFNLENLLRDGSETFRRLNANAADQLAGAQDTKQKRDGQPSLEQGPPYTQGMVHVPDQVHVRLVRHIPDKRCEQDDDNTISGAKQLRDAIAALLCRKGDSEEDGLTWEYVTIIGEPFAVEIEIHERKEKIDAQ